MSLRPHPIARFNNFLATKMSAILSSMWLFWLLTISLIILWIIDPPVTAFEVALFVISTAFQAIALPVLAFVSNIQSDKQTKIIQATHQLVMEELTQLKQQQTELKQLIKQHQQLLDSSSNHAPSS